jgi:hypothetical protein
MRFIYVRLRLGIGARHMIYWMQSVFYVEVCNFVQIVYDKKLKKAIRKQPLPWALESPNHNSFISPSVSPVHFHPIPRHQRCELAL